jgi:hypothetical protein
MRICLILEGSYPYTFGGVSSWTHQMICQMPDIDFVLWVIGARAEDRGHFVYELPKNVKEVHEVFLDDALKIRGSSRISLRLSEEEKTAIRELMNCGRPDWKVLFSLFRDRKVGIGDLLMGEDFLDIMTDLCREDYPYIPYADTFHMMRSMLLPVFYMCQQEIPDADIYHAICTGYAGLLGSMASIRKGKPLLLTEHGIYSREREEEIRIFVNISIVKSASIRGSARRRSSGPTGWSRFSNVTGSASSICYHRSSTRMPFG